MIVLERIAKLFKRDARPTMSVVHIGADTMPHTIWTDDPYEIAESILIAAQIVLPRLHVGQEFTVSLSARPGKNRQFDESVWLSIVSNSYFVNLINVTSVPQADGRIESVYTLAKSEKPPLVM